MIALAFRRPPNTGYRIPDEKFLGSAVWDRIDAACIILVVV
jgi:hypothetical protein